MRRITRGRWFLGAVAALGVTAAVVIPVTMSSGDTTPTKGGIPEALLGNLSDPRVPDYVGVKVPGDRRPAGASTTAKFYVKKTDIPLTDPMPVYEESLTVVVGYMYGGRGFVPLGADPTLVPSVVSTMVPQYAGDTPPYKR